MKKYYNYLLLIFLITSCQPQNEEMVSGAYDALQLMAYSRAYPEKDISKDGYTKAYEKAQREIQPVSQSRDVDPWENIGPYNIGGRTLCVNINPQNPKTIYAGSASGGLWRSFNQGLGVSWHKIPIGFPVLGISSIEFAPNDSMTMYIGTGEVYNIEAAGTGAAYRPTRGTYGVGILKSTDGGVNWEKSLDWSYEQQRGVWQVKVAPTNPNIVYAGTTEGTYKSTDAGATWNQISSVPMVMDLKLHPTNPDIVFIGCGNLFSPGHGIYRTIDGGDNWTKAEAPIPANFGGKVMLDIYGQNPDIVYASIGNSTNSADGYTWLCKTTNGGDTWQVVNEFDYSRFQGWFAHDIAIHPNNPNELAIIGVELFKSTDGGVTIEKKANGGVQFGQLPIGEPDGPPDFSHSDHHDVIYDKDDPNTIYYANDGGIYISFDGGESFQSANGGLLTTQFYNGFSVAQEYSGYAMGGLQDNSTVRYDNDPAWTRVIGGDGSWSAMNALDRNNHFGSAQWLNVFKSVDGENYEGINIPNAGNDFTLFIAPFVLSPTDPNRMYAGRGRVYVSFDNGDSFISNSLTPLNGDGIFAMEVAPSNSDVLYVATAPFNLRPEVFVSTNASGTFDNRTNGLPDRFINDIGVDPNDPATAYVTMGGFGSGHLFKTTDYGENWEDISGDLPDVPTSAVVVDPLDGNYIYVGNDIGVYITTDGGVTWESFNDGFVDATLVMDLKIMEDDRKIYVATHGSACSLRDLVDIEVSTKEPVANINAIENVYPNPFSNILYLELDMDKNEDVSQVELYNVNGQLVHSQNLSSNNNQKIILEGLDHLVSGNYWVRLKSKSGFQQKKVTKL